MGNDSQTKELKEKCLRMAMETPFEGAGFQTSTDVISIAENYYQYITQPKEVSDKSSGLQ